MLLKGIESLRTQFELHHAVGEVKQPLVKNILMVGALFEGDDGSRLSRSDQFYLSQSLSGLSRYNIGLSPDFEVNVLNRNYDEDFLDGSHKADLVILCHIYNPVSADSAPDIERKNALTYATSPKHFDKDTWSNVTKDTGANIVCVYPKEGKNPWFPSDEYVANFDESERAAMKQAMYLAAAGEIRSRYLLVGSDFLKIDNALEAGDMVVRQGYNCVLD